MGWLKALRYDTVHPNSELIHSTDDLHIKSKSDTRNVSHIEDISISSNNSPDRSRYLPFVSLETPDARLPFLSAAEVAAYSEHHNAHPEHRIYLVVENVVYDCTQFIHDHPGGQRVIESFRGQDCSWQFWRFHSEDTMREWGWPLRVARTEGVMNKWKERPRFVGLKRLSAGNEEDW